MVSSIRTYDHHRESPRGQFLLGRSSSSEFLVLIGESVGKRMWVCIKWRGKSGLESYRPSSWGLYSVGKPLRSVDKLLTTRIKVYTLLTIEGRDRTSPSNRKAYFGWTTKFDWRCYQTQKSSISPPVTDFCLAADRSRRDYIRVRKGRSAWTP